MSNGDRLEVADRPGLDVVLADALRDRILRASLQPGAHLVEVDFAKEFGVAHGTVRSAFRHLQAEGLVEYRPRKGMYVAALQPEDVLELCSLRDSLEALGAGLAATNGTKQEQLKLKTIVMSMKDAAEANDHREMIELDLSFHVLVVEMSKHKKLQQMYSMLASQVKLFMTMTDTFHADMHEMHRIHEQLAVPILARDGATAKQRASRHNEPDGLALAQKLREAQQKMSPEKRPTAPLRAHHTKDLGE
jgi:DNA-binding GntR family transcriptional regulator